MPEDTGPWRERSRRSSEAHGTYTVWLHCLEMTLQSKDFFKSLSHDSKINTILFRLKCSHKITSLGKKKTQS